MTDEHFGAEAALETPHVCASCGDAIQVGEDAVLLEVVLPEQGQERVFTNTDNGDYAYSPHFFHKECWLSEHENVEACVLDVDDCVKGCTLPDDVLQCDVCASSIMAREPTLRAQLGELEHSKREPNKQASYVFTPTPGRHAHLCIACTRTYTTEVTSLWDDEFSYSGECAECTAARIWRTGQVCTHEDNE